MFIVELNEGKESLDDIERIAQHISEHEDIEDLIPPNMIEIIEGILQPTLDPDRNEDEKRQLWQRLLNEFVIVDNEDNELKFIRDDTHQRLYFGDKEGFETIMALSDNDDLPSHMHRL